MLLTKFTINTDKILGKPGIEKGLSRPGIDHKQNAIASIIIHDGKVLSP